MWSGGELQGVERSRVTWGGGRGQFDERINGLDNGGER